MIRRFTLALVLIATMVTPIAGALAAPQFEDVPDGHIFSSDISWLADAGITKGCNPPSNDRYCPDDNVTRGQMAAFMTRALGL